MVTSPLVEHLERQLGRIEEGWAVDADGFTTPFQIARFARGSGPDTISVTTLGLSRYDLASPATGRSIRQELLMLAPRELSLGPLRSRIYEVGSAAVGERRALLRGDVIGPYGPLVPGSSLEALYVAMPAYFPDEFATCQTEDGAVVITWLVPITASEAAFVLLHGWSAFEDRLVERDPNLVDFNREPVVT